MVLGSPGVGLGPKVGSEPRGHGVAAAFAPVGSLMEPSPAMLTAAKSAAGV